VKVQVPSACKGAGFKDVDGSETNHLRRERTGGFLGRVAASFPRDELAADAQ
jgi:hypothetical protein